MGILREILMLNLLQFHQKTTWRALALGAGILLSAGMAQAQFTDWTGNNGTDWTDPGNWDNGTPDGSTAAYIDTNSGNMSVLDGTTGATQLLTVGASTGSMATLTLQNGAMLNSSDGHLGDGDGALGMMTVNNAIWTVTNQVEAGNSGTGNLSVLAGGVVNVGDSLYLGENSGGSGTVYVSDTASTVNVTNTLLVGDEGTGNLTIANGGNVSVTGTAPSSFAVIGYDVGSAGNVTVTGGGSQLNLQTDLYLAYQGGVGGLAITAGGNVSGTDAHVGYTGGAAFVTVDGSGSVWNNSGFLNVAEGGTGTVSVTGEGLLNTGSATVGYGAEGMLTVDGAGSKWINSTVMEIGGSGNGTVTIQNGGNFTNGQAGMGYVDSLGAFAGVTGNLIVDGANSTWNNLNDFVNVGGPGVGNVTIQNGGNATVTSMAVDGTGTGYGTVTITGANSTMYVNGYLTVGYGGQGNLTVADGGLLDTTGAFSGVQLGLFTDGNGTVTVTGANSTWNVGAGTTLDIGDGSQGALMIEDSGVVNADGMTIGDETGAQGNVTVTGSGARLTLTADLYMANNGGTGGLDILCGGNVTGTNAHVGYFAGAAYVTVDGAGSVWNNSGNVNVAEGATGMITVTNGGLLSTNSATVGYGADGSVTVDGANSTWINSTGLEVGGSGNGTVTVENGGNFTNGISGEGYIDTLGSFSGETGTIIVDGANSTWNELNDFIDIGLDGVGNVSVRNGGYANMTAPAIGENGDGTGLVTVDGTNSTLKMNYYVMVGDSGNGTLTVSGGGLLDTTQAGSTTLGNNGTGNGTVIVTGANSTWNGSGSDLYVGIDGVGNLSVLDGGNVTSQFVSIGGYDPTDFGSGSATVSGTNSTWNIEAALYVGDGGNGTLVIADGGKVKVTGNDFNFGSGYIGYGSSANGTVTVTGANSTWCNAEDLYVGYMGTGNLSIMDGGKVTNFNAFIGAVGSGNATVDGAGSRWDSDGDMVVGLGGTGNLTISGGGKVTSGNGMSTVGFSDGAVGGVTVTGSGSTWVNFGDLYVGGGGQGTVDIADGGTLKVSGGNLILGASDSAVANVTVDAGGTLKVGGTDGIQTQGGSYTLTLAGGTLGVIGADLTTSVNITLGSGTDTTIGTGDLNATLSGTVMGGGGINKTGNGTLTLAVANSYTGNTTVHGGTVQVNDTLASTTFNIASGNLAVGGDNLLPNTATMSVGPGGDFKLCSFNQTLGNVTLSGGSVTGTGLLTIRPGAILAGAGTITADVALTEDAVMAPGNGSIGVIQAGNITWNGSSSGASTALFTLSDVDGSSSLLTLTGNFLKGTGTTFKFDFGGTGFGSTETPTVYTLIAFAGTTNFSPGDFSYVNLGGAHTSGTFNLNSGALTLTVVPEPGTWGGMAATAALLAAWRKRRR